MLTSEGRLEACKRYYLKLKQKPLEERPKSFQKLDCECGVKYFKSNEISHLKSKNHLIKLGLWVNKEKKHIFDCECGFTYTTGNKTCHLRTKKHQNFINLKEKTLPLHIVKL